MRHNDGPICDFHNTFGHFKKLRGVDEHFAIDSCQPLHKRLNVALGVDQAGELIHHRMAIKTINGDLGNALFVVFPPCGFNVQNRVHLKGFFLQKSYSPPESSCCLLQWPAGSRRSSPSIGRKPPAIVFAYGQKRLSIV